LLKYIKNNIAFILLILGTVIYCFNEATGRGDFYIFLSAAGDLGKQQDIFKNTYVDGYHYYYSVLFALLLKPFESLPFYFIKLVWLLFNLFLFIHLFRLLMRTEFVKQLSQKQKLLFQLCVLLFTSRFLRDNIHHSQVTVLILWCCVYGLILVNNDKPLRGALLLALGINIKLLPIVFLPYLFYRGYFKAVFFAVIFYVALLFGPSLFIGHDYNMSLLKTWFHLINPTNQVHVLDVDERTFHGLSTLLSTLLVENVPDIYALPIKRNVANVSLQTLSTILLLTRLLLVSFTVYFTGFSFFKKVRSKWQACMEVSYILLVIPLVFPHQQPYAFLFVVPAASCILYYLIKGNIPRIRKRVLISVLVLIFLSFDLKLLLGEFDQYYNHFKILTYGALLLIPLLAYTWKKSHKDHLFLSNNT
jgi:hypothetical protein